MSTELASFESTLEDVDVEFVLVDQEGLTGAIEDFIVGDAVGVADEAWTTSLPDSVDETPTAVALDSATTGITPVEFAISDYGSLILPTRSTVSELISLHVDRHVGVLDESDIVPDMASAFDRLENDISSSYGDAIIATGPSATADMGALVKGAHGPSEVRVVVVEE